MPSGATLEVPSGRFYFLVGGWHALLKSNASGPKMSSSWQANLEQSLRAAGIGSSNLDRAELDAAFCNRIAELVARAYLQGETSWLAADAVINHLYPLMLECPSTPEYAWTVYEAFDAGEYHPDTPELADEAVTKAALLNREAANVPEVSPQAKP